MTCPVCGITLPCNKLRCDGCGHKVNPEHRPRMQFSIQTPAPTPEGLADRLTTDTDPDNLIKRSNL